MNTRLLNTSQIAKKLQIRKATAAQWRWKRYGPPYVKIGRCVFYRESDVDQWIEQQLVRP